MRVPMLMGLLFTVAGANATEVTVHISKIEDRKAVIATVEPVRQLVARARIGGTIVSLKAREGDEVAAAAIIAVVADQKLALQTQALDQRIRSQQAQRDQAKSDFDRVQELQRRGVSTQPCVLTVASLNSKRPRAPFSRPAPGGC
jgi:multidrug efflux system membrane fusion protein